MDEWYQKFYSDLNIKITEKELQIVTELHQILLEKMLTINKHNLINVEPHFLLEGCDHT